MASVNWTADAIVDLEAIDAAIAKRIVVKVGWLGEHFDEVIREKLHRDLKGLYKPRAGDFRVVYSVREGSITIERIAHRRDIYK